MSRYTALYAMPQATRARTARSRQHVSSSVRHYAITADSEPARSSSGRRHHAIDISLMPCFDAHEDAFTRRHAVCHAPFHYADATITPPTFSPLLLRYHFRLPISFSIITISIFSLLLPCFSLRCFSLPADAADAAERCWRFSRLMPLIRARHERQLFSPFRFELST